MERITRKPTGTLVVLLPLLLLCHTVRLAQTDFAPDGAPASANPPVAISTPQRLQPIDIEHLARSRGFHLETHTITTRDQYVLRAHRLRNPLLAARQLAGAVVIQHGILCASPFFLLNSSPSLDRPRAPARANASAHARVSNSLAIELANRGYDVWLTNFRGTEKSRGHLRGPHIGQAYWNFNVDTLIEHDWRAYSDYILRATRRPSFTFVGHSLGATVGLGALLVHQGARSADGAAQNLSGGRGPERSRLARRLDCAILMAPVASTNYMHGSLMPLFRLATLLYDRLAPFPGASDSFSLYVRQLCLQVPQMCAWLASMFVGVKQQTTPLTPQLTSADDHEFGRQLNTFLLMMQQSISIQTLEHIVQVHSSGRLSRFNFGPAGNLLAYGTPLAPIYDLAQIKAPDLALAIVSAPSDAISTPEEIEWISRQVRGRVKLLEQIDVSANPFNHMDLVISQDAGELVNRRLVDFIEQNKCSANV